MVNCSRAVHFPTHVSGGFLLVQNFFFQDTLSTRQEVSGKIFQSVELTHHLLHQTVSRSLIALMRSRRAKRSVTRRYRC